MMKTLRFSRFWRLATGLLFLGMGQRLLYTGVISPVVVEEGLSLILTSLSLLFLIIGIVLIFPIAIWFYRQYRSDKRLNHTILIYLFSAILCGILIGGFGQILYDNTSLEYDHVKTAIWAFTTIIQTFFKVILSYSLVSIYKVLPIKSRVEQLRLPVLISTILVAFCLAIATWFPILGSFILSISDAFILIFTLYYFIYLAKENNDEKTS
ncbi:putative membrane protein [Streptococcus sp. oral taxon 056 str. F0418]|uniref:hypothetical protein n=1 Tax=Streptococcus sp. oral taxon 056 TaxID=712620 RepID=UPI00021812DA|nr:hypothetical protein [Streptococcus sp. oral taxon 056]EGP67547.1 putative membrane protein [Streptococcus sp. oral taxon 056 str. F0418]